MRINAREVRRGRFVVDAQEHLGEHELEIRVGVRACLHTGQLLERVQIVVGEAAGEKREVLVAVAGAHGQRTEHVGGRRGGEALALVRGHGCGKLVNALPHPVLLQPQARCDHLAGRG